MKSPVYLRLKHACLVVFAEVSFISTLAINFSLASPCYPNDPSGENPGNLCLTYPPSWTSLPNVAPDQSPFVQGTGINAFYGYPVSPNQPGKYMGKTSGYWTNIEAVNGSTAITDSNGNTIKIP